MQRSNLLRAAVVALAAVHAGVPPAVAAPEELTAEERATRIEEVRRTELAFAATVRENRPEEFAALLDEATVFVGPAGVLRGRDAVVEAWAGLFGDDRPDFEWHPEVVELTGDGSLGLSRGPWVLRVKRPDGGEVESRGLFNSVWRRQADGSWRIVFDAGCGCPPAGG